MKNKKIKKKGLAFFCLGLIVLFLIAMVNSENQIENNTDFASPSALDKPAENQEKITENIPLQEETDYDYIEIDELLEETIENSTENKKDISLDDNPKNQTDIESAQEKIEIQSNQTISSLKNNSEQNMSEENKEAISQIVEIVYEENNNRTQINPEKNIDEIKYEENQDSSSTSSGILIDIDKLINDSENNSQTNNLSKLKENEPQTELITLSNEGCEELTINTQDLDKGIKKESKEPVEKRDSWLKEITVQSNKHVSNPLTNYEKIPEILTLKQKDKIKIYWKNKDIYLDFIALDKDNDNLIDMVKWEIPHLSNQTFEIRLNLNVSNRSSVIGLKINNAPSGTLANPITFDLEIDYINLSLLDCDLALNGVPTPINPSQLKSNLTKNLPNGTYVWSVNCKDIDASSSESRNGTFSINENFLITTDHEVYLNKENVHIEIQLKNITNVTIRHNNGTVVYQNSHSFHTSGPYPHLNRTFSPGVYEIAVSTDYLVGPTSFKKNFSVASAEINTDKTDVEVNENINATIKINSPNNKITSYELKFGDSTNSNTEIFWPYEDHLERTIKHAYLTAGDYTLTLITFIGNRQFRITKNGVNVENNADTQKPSVTFLSPADNSIINSTSLTLSYKASDNIKLQNCTFEIYNYSKGFGELDYSTTQNNLDNDEVVEIKLKDFKKGDYSWNVFCCDNSSNCNGDLDFEREFTISDSKGETIAAQSENSDEESHEKTEEIKSMISKVDSFLEKEKTYGPDEKEVMESLGLTTDLQFFQKRLVQIDQDLSHNIDYIKEADLRAKRREETLAELEQIKGQIPNNLRIVSKTEYVKNSLTQDMENIVKDYVEAENIKLDKSGIKKLTELNYKIQSQITVSTKIMQIEISYEESIDSITLITKEITLKNSSFGQILEVIPKEIVNNANEVNFLTENTVIKEDPIFKISVDSLENNKIIYSLEGFVDPKELEKTETILFHEFPLEGIGITGFFISDFREINFSFYYLLFIAFFIVIIYLLITFIQKMRVYKWKKEEDVVRIFKLIKGCKKAIIKKDINSAKEKYHSMQEIYPLITDGCKRYINKDIKKIRVAIDKKEIFGLAKEYEQAKRENRTEDAKIIYEKIRKIYKRQPKKYQAIIYNKMFKPKT